MAMSAIMHDTTIKQLQRWCDADQADTKIISRGEIIFLLEEIYRLRAALAASKTK